MIVPILIGCMKIDIVLNRIPVMRAIMDSLDGNRTNAIERPGGPQRLSLGRLTWVKTILAVAP